MNSLLAFCPVHGLFASVGLSLAKGAQATFIDCTTRCPNCGGVSEVIPGAYKSDAGKLNVLIDPSVSREALLAIQKVVVRLQKGEINEQEARQEVEAVAPKVAKLFDFSKWSGKDTVNAALAIGTLITALLAAKVHQPNVTINNFYPPAIHETHPKGEKLLSPESLKGSTSLSGIPTPRQKPE